MFRNPDGHSIPDFRISSFLQVRPDVILVFGRGYTVETETILAFVCDVAEFGTCRTAGGAATGVASLQQR